MNYTKDMIFNMIRHKIVHIHGWERNIVWHENMSTTCYDISEEQSVKTSNYEFPKSVSQDSPTCQQTLQCF